MPLAVANRLAVGEVELTVVQIEECGTIDKNMGLLIGPQFLCSLAEGNPGERLKSMEPCISVAK